MAGTVKVMLLGDSIRMSYQPLVARLLAGRAEVLGPADNCQYSLYTLSSLARWANELGKPDIVHWNNGLHDAGHNPQRHPIQIPIDMYRANLAHILDALSRLTDKITYGRQRHRCTLNARFAPMRGPGETRRSIGTIVRPLN